MVKLIFGHLNICLVCISNVICDQIEWSHISKELMVRHLEFSHLHIEVIIQNLLGSIEHFVDLLRLTFHVLVLIVDATTA